MFLFSSVREGRGNPFCIGNERSGTRLWEIFLQGCVVHTIFSPPSSNRWSIRFDVNGGEERGTVQCTATTRWSWYKYDGWKKPAFSTPSRREALEIFSLVVDSTEFLSFDRSIQWYNARLIAMFVYEKIETV